MYYLWIPITESGMPLRSKWYGESSHLYHSAKSTYANDINNKKTNIVDVLQARFLTKEKHKVTNLYIDVMVEKMHMMLSGN